MSHWQFTLLNSEMNVDLLHCGDRTIKASYHGSGNISKGLSDILTHLINRRYVMCGARGFKTAICKSANCFQVLKYCQYFYNWGTGEARVWKFPDFAPSDGASNSPKQPYTHLLLDEAITHWAFLTLVRRQVVEVVHLTFVTLIANEALATVTGTITVTLHGNGAHRVTVTGCGVGWGGGGEAPVIILGVRNAFRCHLYYGIDTWRTRWLR